MKGEREGGREGRGGKKGGGEQDERESRERKSLFEFHPMYHS